MTPEHSPEHTLKHRSELNLSDAERASLNRSKEELDYILTHVETGLFVASRRTEERHVTYSVDDLWEYHKQILISTLSHGGYAFRFEKMFDEKFVVIYVDSPEEIAKKEFQMLCVFGGVAILLLLAACASWYFFY